MISIVTCTTNDAKPEYFDTLAIAVFDLPAGYAPLIAETYPMDD